MSPKHFAAGFRRPRRHRVLLAAIGTVLIDLATTAAPASATPALAPAVQVDRDDFNQTFPNDVYVFVEGSLLNPDETTPADAPLYTIQGSSLDMTWGKWKSASASSLVIVAGNAQPQTLVTIRAGGLIPNAVYSVFYLTFGPDTMNPACPGVERGLPVRALFPVRRPDASSFVADASGKALYVGRIGGDLLQAQNVVLELIWHPDGHTYDPLPNNGEFLTQGPQCRSSFAFDAHRQLLILQK